MVAAVATGADETFEMIDAGVGVALVSAGNAELYRREGVVALPGRGPGAERAGRRLAAGRAAPGRAGHGRLPLDGGDASRSE